MRKTIMALAVIGMLLCVASVAMAKPMLPQQPSVALYTEVSGSGKISIDQFSDAKDVLMQTKVRMPSGTLNFEQKLVESKRMGPMRVLDKFVNDIRMNGQGIYLDNMAGKSEGSMYFNQKLKIAESSQNWDELKSKQVFTKIIRGCDHERVFKMIEEFQLNPTANQGHECEPDAAKYVDQEGVHNMGIPIDSMMHQKAKVTGDYIFAKIKAKLPNGDVAKSQVKQFNAADWTTIEQMITSSSMMP